MFEWKHCWKRVLGNNVNWKRFAWITLTNVIIICEDTSQIYIFPTNQVISIFVKFIQMNVMTSKSFHPYTEIYFRFLWCSQYLRWTTRKTAIVLLLNSTDWPQIWFHTPNHSAAFLSDILPCKYFYSLWFPLPLQQLITTERD